LWQRIKPLREDPYPPNSWPLSGAWAGLRKIRVGDYRIIYGVDDKARLVRVVRVGHRHNVYD
jgi:mRNA interferase RelE/StbE